MSQQDSTLTVRVNKADKEQADAILKSLGLNLSSAIGIYLKAIVREEGIPFKVTKKNVEEVTRKAGISQ